MRPHGVERILAVFGAALAVGLTQPLVAQRADAPRAPRILDTPASSPPAPAPTTVPERPLELPAVTLPDGRRPPNAARLAPLPEERNEPEEIIVIGQGFRLPDLGSEWRARQKEDKNEGRFSATALPLYDPNKPPLHSEAFMSREQRRHGYIELFRLRFGKRSRD